MSLYAIALGSNQRHHSFGAPRAILSEAIKALNTRPLRCIALATPHTSLPIGPSSRAYSNSAVLIETMLAPDALLAHLQQIEARFGRKRQGQRWRARTLDLDIILWSGGAYTSPHLTIPHPAFRARRFVLQPLRQIVPHWRDPLTGLFITHLISRLDRAARHP